MRLMNRCVVRRDKKETPQALPNVTLPAQIFSVEPSMLRRSDVAEISVDEDRTSAVAKAD
jgi:hypothetical protein